MRRHRPIIAIILALLLVLMQQGALLHEIGHDRDRLLHANDTGLQVPVTDGPCALCALFAGGAAAVVSTFALHTPSVADRYVPWQAIAHAAFASPSPYQSRAPPSTL